MRGIWCCYESMSWRDVAEVSVSGECDRGSDRDENYKMERVNQEEAGKGAANAKAPVEGADWCCESSMGERPGEMRAETQRGLTTEVTTEAN